MEFNNQKYEEIKELTGWQLQESKHFMPNEIFEDLQSDLFKSSAHRAFAYSYYYLISWLYRYAKYGENSITNETIKQMLGYSKNNKTINYIIKNNGVLDLLQYTETVKNYPISWTFDEYEEPTFTLVDELDEEMKELIAKGRSRKYSVKYPIKHFYREEDEEDDYGAGIFFDVRNTHMIDFKTFIFCMSNQEIGTGGFYLYGYLKMKNQLFEDGYDVTLRKLSEDTGIPYMSMNRYLDELRKHNLIVGIHNQEYFSQGLSDYERKANTYVTNNPSDFTFESIPYKKMEVKKVSEHLVIKRKNKPVKVEIELSELPY